MKALMTALGNKYFLWALIVIGVLGTFQMRSCQMKENEKLQTYNRQLQGQLSDKERELQEDLTERWKKEKEEIDKKFEKFKKEHNLKIRSKDRTIAALKQQIQGGDTDVGVTPVGDGDTVVISQMRADVLA